MIPVVVREGPPGPDHEPILARPGVRLDNNHELADPPVRWVDGGSRLELTTWGSSSAPSVLTAVYVDGNRLTMTLGVRARPMDWMTSDRAPHVTVFETPVGLDPRRPSVVRINARDHDLPPVDGG